MKILSVSIYSQNRNPLISNQNKPKNKAYKPSPIISSYVPNFYYPIAFTSNKNYKALFNTVLNMENVCPCCGKHMLPKITYRKIFKPTNLSKNSKEVIKIIRKYEAFMPEPEKTCFIMLKKQSKNQGHKSLNHLLREFRQSSLKKLQQSEFEVIDEIEKLAMNLSEESKSRVSKITQIARAVITKDDPENQFKRKKFIWHIAAVRDQIPEKELGDKLVKEAEKLKTSENDLNAFIVKYSNRTSTELAQRLVSKSVATIEHTKPQSKGGQDLLGNFLSECAGCNNSRGDKPLDEWIEKSHPEMLKNIQKHIDKIIRKINEGKLEGFETYPLEISETLSGESKGLIKLDISKLNKTK